MKLQDTLPGKSLQCLKSIKHRLLQNILSFYSRRAGHTSCPQYSTGKAIQSGAVTFIQFSKVVFHPLHFGELLDKLKFLDICIVSLTSSQSSWIFGEG